MKHKTDLQARRRSLMERATRKAIEVRKLQTNYFRTKSSGVLYAAQAAERELDSILADFERIERQLSGAEAVQNTLFDGTP